MRIFVIIAVCAFIVPLVVSQSSESPQYKVDVVRTEPFPLLIGNNATVFFTVQNVGDGHWSDLEISFNPGGPFRVPGTEKTQWDVGEIFPGEIYSFSFDMRVNGDASPGTEEMTFRFHSQDKGISVEQSVPVAIRERNSVLEIEQVDTTPSLLAPGGRGKVEFTLHNTAKTPMYDVDVSMDVADDVVVPAGATSSLYVDHIAPQSRQTVTFPVKAKKSAEASTYLTTVNVSYEDDAGQLNTIEEKTGLSVGDVPDVKVHLDSKEVETKGTTGSLTLSVVNRGAVESRFTQLHVQDTEQFTLLSPSQIYIGNMRSDDFDTVELRVHVPPNTVEDTLQIPVSVMFENAAGETFTVNRTITSRLYSDTEAVALGLQERNTTIWYVIGGAVIIAGIFAYRWWRRRNNG